MKINNTIPSESNRMMGDTNQDINASSQPSFVPFNNPQEATSALSSTASASASNLKSKHTLPRKIIYPQAANPAVSGLGQMLPRSTPLILNTPPQMSASLASIPSGSASNLKNPHYLQNKLLISFTPFKFDIVLGTYRSLEMALVNFFSRCPENELKEYRTRMTERGVLLSPPSEVKMHKMQNDILMALFNAWKQITKPTDKCETILSAYFIYGLRFYRSPDIQHEDQHLPKETPKGYYEKLSWARFLERYLNALAITSNPKADRLPNNTFFLLSQIHSNISSFYSDLHKCASSEELLLARGTKLNLQKEMIDFIRRYYPDYEKSDFACKALVSRPNRSEVSHPTPFGCILDSSKEIDPIQRHILEFIYHKHAELDLSRRHLEAQLKQNSSIDNPVHLEKSIEKAHQSLLIFFDFVQSLKFEIHVDWNELLLRIQRGNTETPSESITRQDITQGISECKLIFLKKIYKHHPDDNSKLLLINALSGINNLNGSVPIKLSFHSIQTMPDKLKEILNRLRSITLEAKQPSMIDGNKNSVSEVIKPVDQIAREKNIDFEALFKALQNTFLSLTIEQRKIATSVYNKLFNGIDTLFKKNYPLYKTLKELIYSNSQGYWAIPLVSPQSQGDFNVSTALKRLLTTIFYSYSSELLDSKEIANCALYSFLRHLHFTIPKNTQESISNFSKINYLKQFIPDEKNTQNFIEILSFALYEQSLDTSKNDSSLVPLNNIDLRKRAEAALFFLKFNQIKKWNFQKESSNQRNLHGFILLDSNEKELTAYRMQLKFFHSEGKTLCDEGLIEALTMDDQTELSLSLSQLEKIRDKLKGAIPAQGSDIQCDFVFDPVLMQLPYDISQSKTTKESIEDLEDPTEKIRKPKRQLGNAPEFSEEPESKRITPLKQSDLEKRNIISGPNKKKAPSPFHEVTLDTVLAPLSQNPALKTKVTQENELDNLTGNVSSTKSDNDLITMLLGLSEKHIEQCSKRLKIRTGIQNSFAPLSYEGVEKLATINIAKIESIAQECIYPYQAAKDYQLTVLKALKVFQEAQINVVVSADVGTGKTHLALGEIIEKICSSEKGSFLICSPLSLIEQTKESIITFFAINRLILIQNLLNKQNSSKQLYELLNLAVKECKIGNILNKNEETDLRDKAVQICQTLSKQCAENTFKNSSSFIERYKSYCNKFESMSFRVKNTFESSFDALQELISSNPPAENHFITLFEELSKIKMQDTQQREFVTQVLNFVAECVGNKESSELTKEEEIKTLKKLCSINLNTFVIASNRHQEIGKAIEELKDCSSHRVIISTPDTISKKQDLVKDTSWTEIFYDEAHLVARKADSKKWKHHRPIADSQSQKGPGAQIRLLTATPFQGQISDLYNLMMFAHKSGSFSSTTFNKLKTKLDTSLQNAKTLLKGKLSKNSASELIKNLLETFAHFQVFKEINNSYIYRLKKDDPRVVKAWGGKILDKEFHNHNYTLTDSQKKQIETLTSNGSSSANQSSESFFSRDNALDSVLLHPQIPLKKILKKDIDIKVQQVALVNKITKLPQQGGMSDDEFDTFVNESGFLKAYLEATSTYVNQRKQWITFVDKIFHGEFLQAAIQRKFLDKVDVSFYTGQDNTQQRSSLVAAFKNENQRSKCMLMTIQAGGVGLNIPGVHIHLLSKPWNPSDEEQAIGRSDRVGHSGTIEIHRYNNLELDKRYEHIVESKKSWDAYLGCSHKDLLSELKMFMNIVGSQIQSTVEDKSLDEKQTACDDVYNQVVEYINSRSENGPNAFIQEYIDQASPKGLDNLRKIKEIALKPIQNKYKIAHPSDSSSRKASAPQASSSTSEAESSNAPQNLILKISIPKKAPVATIQGLSTASTIFPKALPSFRIRTQASLMEPVKAPQAASSSTNAPTLNQPFTAPPQRKVPFKEANPSQPKVHPIIAPTVPLKLPQKVHLKNSDSNRISSFDVMALNQHQGALDVALELGIAELQVRLEPQNQLFKTLNSSIQALRNDQKKSQKLNIQPILDEIKKLNTAYKSIDACQKAGFQVEMYELDKNDVPGSLKKMATHPSTHPKGCKGSIRLLVSNENNNKMYTLLLREFIG